MTGCWHQWHCCGLVTRTRLPLELGERPRCVAEMLRLAVRRQLREPGLCSCPKPAPRIMVERSQAPEHVGQRLQGTDHEAAIRRNQARNQVNIEFQSSYDRRIAKDDAVVQQTRTPAAQVCTSSCCCKPRNLHCAGTAEIIVQVVSRVSLLQHTQLDWSLPMCNAAHAPGCSPASAGPGSAQPAHPAAARRVAAPASRPPTPRLPRSAARSPAAWRPSPPATAPRARRPAAGPAAQAHAARSCCIACPWVRAMCKGRRGRSTLLSSWAQDAVSKGGTGASPHGFQDRLSTASRVKAALAEVNAQGRTHAAEGILCWLRRNVGLQVIRSVRWYVIKLRRAPWRVPTGRCTGSAACTSAAAPACAVTGQPAYNVVSGSRLVENRKTNQPC